MMQWYRAWRERRAKAKRERDALIRIVALLKEQDAQVRGTITRLGDAHEQSTAPKERYYKVGEDGGQYEYEDEPACVVGGSDGNGGAWAVEYTEGHDWDSGGEPGMDVCQRCGLVCEWVKEEAGQ